MIVAEGSVGLIQSLFEVFFLRRRSSRAKAARVGVLIPEAFDCIIASRSVAMKWEYLSRELPWKLTVVGEFIEEATKLGSEGWELVSFFKAEWHEQQRESFYRLVAIFKRPCA